MNCKLILLDMDDTLLNTKKIITKRTRTAILRASEMGIKIGYVTARSPRTVLNIVKGLPVDAYSYYGGVKTFCDDKCISDKSMPNSECASVLRGYWSKKQNGFINLYFEPYSMRHNILFKEWVQSKESVEKAMEGRVFQRLMVRTSEFPIIEEFITTNMRTVNTRHGDTIIVHKDADKGHAARVIMSHYDVLPEETIAFGDDASDLSMFRACGMSVAMENAIYETKSAARDITDSCNDDGVGKWMEKNILKQ